MGVAVATLGPLRALVDGTPIDLGGAKPREVLRTILLGRGHLVSTDAIVERVWGAHPPSSATGSVRSYVSRLRTALADGHPDSVILTASGGYAIDRDHPGLVVDLYDFEQQLEAARAGEAAGSPDAASAAARQALAHWPGTTNPIEVVRPCFADLDTEFGRLADLHHEATAILARSLLDLGRPDEAIAPLEVGVISHPYSEQLRSLLMISLFRSGRAADALDQFQTARRILADELGMEPSPMLADLERRILVNDPQLDVRGSNARHRRPSPVVAEPDDIPPGRATEHTIASALLPTEPGRSSNVIVVNGPTGIGKTTMLDAIGRRATARGAFVATGHCHEATQSATLAPWISVIRDLMDHAGDAATSLLGPQAPELSLLLPEVGADEPANSTGHSLQDAIIRLLKRFAERTPLLVVLEDLHWADEPSLAVAAAAAQRLGPGHPITFAFSWRDTDASVDALISDSAAARNRALSDLARCAGIGRMVLEGIDETTAADLYQREHGRSPTPDQIAALVDHTGGHPLYLSELIRSDAFSDHLDPPTTRSISEAVQRRLESLPADAREILHAAALCTRQFDEELLTAVTGRAASEVTTGIDIAIAAQLLGHDEGRPDRLRFRHSLIESAIADRVPRAQAMAIHRRIGRVLVERSGSPEQITHHLLRGGRSVVDDAARWAQRAALQAARLHDHAGAILLLETGIGRLTDAGQHTELTIDLLLDLAVAQIHDRRIEQAHDSCRRAFERARTVGSHQLMAVAALVYCGQGRIDRERRSTEWMGYWSDPAVSIPMLEAALAAPPPVPHKPQLLLALSNELFGRFEDSARSDQLTAEALAELRAGKDRAALCHALLLAASADVRRHDLAQRRHLYTEGLDLAMEVGDRRSEIGFRRLSMTLALDEGSLAAAEAEVAAAHATAAASGDAVLSMQATVMENALLLFRGRFDHAADSIEQAFETFGHLGSAALDLLAVQYGALMQARGRLGEVEAMLRLWLDGYDGPNYAAPLAAVLAKAGKHEDARAILQRFPAEVICSPQEGVLQFMTIAFFAEVVAELDESELAAALVEPLTPAVGRTIAMYGGAVYFGLGSHAVARLHLALGEFDRAETLLEQALDQAGRLHAAAEEVGITITRAELAAKRGRYSEADQLVDQARNLATPLAMEWMVESAGHRLAAVEN